MVCNAHKKTFSIHLQIPFCHTIYYRMLSFLPCGYPLPYQTVRTSGPDPLSLAGICYPSHCSPLPPPKDTPSRPEAAVSSRTSARLPSLFSPFKSVYKITFLSIYVPCTLYHLHHTLYWGLGSTKGCVQMGTDTLKPEQHKWVPYEWKMLGLNAFGKLQHWVVLSNE